MPFYLWQNCWWINQTYANYIRALTSNSLYQTVTSWTTHNLTIQDGQSKCLLSILMESIRTSFTYLATTIAIYLHRPETIFSHSLILLNENMYLEYRCRFPIIESKIAQHEGIVRLHMKVMEVIKKTKMIHFEVEIVWLNCGRNDNV